MTALYKLIGYLILFLILPFQLPATEETKTPQLKIVASTPEQKAAGMAEHIAIFENFPINQEFEMGCSRTITDSSKINWKITIDKEGILLINGIKTMTFALHSFGFASGERSKLRCVASDGTLLAETSYIPKPLSTKSKKETFSVSAELLSFAPTSYLIKIEGVAEEEKLSVLTTSGKEVVEKDFVFSSKDAPVVFPGVQGKKGGKATIKITRESGDSANLALKWDSAITKDLIKEHENQPDGV